jgi:hypothetical protein
MLKPTLVLALCLATQGLSAQCKSVNAMTLDCTVIGPVVSGGVGDNMGFKDTKDAWGSISSEPVPGGYILRTVYFSLEGPHPCTGMIWFDPWKGKNQKPGEIGIINLPNAEVGNGKWANCRQGTKTDTSVTWKYQFQGWRAERRYLTTTAQGVPAIQWDEVNESIKQRAVLHTVWTKTQ